MIARKHIDRVVWIAVAAAVLLAVLSLAAPSLGVEAADAPMGYETRLFDTSRVHTIDIVMDDWDSFIENCGNEEYASCSVVIDSEAVKKVGIRAKGNYTLRTVLMRGGTRHSFKLEFDHYDESKNYRGLDKLCLNNVIMDNTCMKDYLCYELMRSFGVAALLCSFVNVTVNGAAWGFYLAVEGVEDAFLRRNYGTDTGTLYTPDTQFFGGRGDGAKDVKLQYIDDEPDSYGNIFDHAKTEIGGADRTRLIAALKVSSRATRKAPWRSSRSSDISSCITSSLTATAIPAQRASSTTTICTKRTESSP